MNTTGKRVTIGTASLAAALGLALTGHGIVAVNMPHVVGGASVTMTGLVFITLLLIRSWIVDTSTERATLAQAEAHAQAVRDRYFAAQAALEGEQSRLNRDLAAEQARIAARLKVEREALEAEFEERRAELIAETMEATVLMMRSGKATSKQPAGNLIRFPKQQPDQEPQRARSREHGVVGP